MPGDARFAETNIDVNVIRAAQPRIIRCLEVIDSIAAGAGMSSDSSRTYAYDWIAQLQGALMLHASWGDESFFDGVLQRLLMLANGPDN